VIHRGDKTYILDAKWKVLNGTRPADDDLKQMYVYTKYFESNFTALVYPDDSIISSKGSFLHEQNEDKGYPCSLIKLQLPPNTTNLISWQKEICSEFLTHICS
jgi:5-methylcytosine-specific restriction enzyme subunit McrC